MSVQQSGDVLGLDPWYLGPNLRAHYEPNTGVE